MRVTGGVARGRRLKSPVAGTRPTSDLVRAAIFDVLKARNYSLSPALDLYAGSGALGIEALSRGGERCDFIERNPRNAAMIEENLRSLRLKGNVIRADVAHVAEQLDTSYALVLADPPYDDRDAACVLDRLAMTGVLAPHATVVLEHSSRQSSPANLGPLARVWERRYGDTQVSIYRPDDEQDDQGEEDRS